MSKKEPCFYFFSYGSNLLLERIKARTPSVDIIQPYKLTGYGIIFNKISDDGSTKTNIENNGNLENYVLGIVHRIDIKEKSILDRDEAGYHLESKIISLEDNHQIMLNFYVANSERIQLGKPYSWYLNYVIMGAMENKLPRDYIDQLLSVEDVEDEKKEMRSGYNKELTEKIDAHKKRNPEVWRTRDNRE